MAKWGFKPPLSDDVHEAIMWKRDEWINELWKACRINLRGSMPQPQTQREHCEGRHGGDWDKWEWRGESYDDERAYCLDCGRSVRGVPSPWHTAAYNMWLNTKWMKDRERARALERAATHIKFGKRGNRTIMVAPLTSDSATDNLGELGWHADEYGSKTWFG